MRIHLKVKINKYSIHGKFIGIQDRPIKFTTFTFKKCFCMELENQRNMEQNFGKFLIIIQSGSNFKIFKKLRFDKFIYNYALF